MQQSVGYGRNKSPTLHRHFEFGVTSYLSRYVRVLRRSLCRAARRGIMDAWAPAATVMDPPSADSGLTDRLSLQVRQLTGSGLELRNHFDLNFKLSRPGRPEWTWTWIIMVGTGVARLTEEIHGPVDSVGWIQERGLRQRSIGPTSWWQLLECGRPNMRWQGWSGSVIHPLAAKIRLSTVYTVRIKPAIYQNAAENSCNLM